VAQADIKRDDMAQVYLGMLGLLVCGACIAWITSRSEISYFALKWAWLQWSVFDWPFMPASFIHARKQLATLAMAPDRISIAQLITILNQAGRLFVAIPMLITLYGFHLALKHPANRTRRTITAVSLPRIMATHSPAVTPTLYYGDLLNTDEPEHRSAINPEEWVRLHGLLIDKTLDRDACRKCLAADLGSTVSNLHALAPHEKALFAVFGARLFGEGDEKKVAQDLLDKLNRSCHTGTWQGKPGYPDVSLCEQAFHTYVNHPSAPAWLTRHPYPRTLLHAMHKEALKYGRLPSSQFRWLKGMDRPLWYALNTTGRKAPFMESAAVFTQALWEDFAARLGYRLSESCLDGAIDGLEAYLQKVGLISSTDKENGK